MERFDEAGDDVLRSGVVREDNPFLFGERKCITSKERFYRMYGGTPDIWNAKQACTIEL